jgi:hypothetical protein
MGPSRALVDPTTRTSPGLRSYLTLLQSIGKSKPYLEPPADQTIPPTSGGNMARARANGSEVVFCGRRSWHRPSFWRLSDKQKNLCPQPTLGGRTKGNTLGQRSTKPYQLIGICQPSSPYRVSSMTLRQEPSANHLPRAGNACKFLCHASSARSFPYRRTIESLCNNRK